jgi:hypothetical protein
MTHSINHNTLTVFKKKKLIDLIHYHSLIVPKIK